METSDLPSDADNTNATIAINLPTESKSVKRLSSERSTEHPDEAPHRSKWRHQPFR